MARSEQLPSPEQSPETMDVGAATIASELHPESNEDSLFVRKGEGFFGIFDGVGGEAAGDVASAEASKSILSKLETLEENFTLPEMREDLRKAVENANDHLLQLSSQHSELRGMGTTACIAKIVNGKQGERHVVVANIGDSRAYIVKPDGRMLQITLDDNILKRDALDEAWVLQKKLNEVTSPTQLTARELHFFENINRIDCLGARRVEVSTYTARMSPGDNLLLTTDGVSDNLTDSEMGDILASSDNTEQATEALTRAAQQRSRENHFRAKPDDMSVILIEFMPRGLLPYVGRSLNVRRSSGVFDIGWKVHSYDYASGYVTVIKEEGKNILSKEILAQELTENN